MHKRLELPVERYHITSVNGVAGMDFFNKAEVSVFRLEKTNSGFCAIVPEYDTKLMLRGVKLLDDIDWLFIDFDNNPQLHRIGVRTYQLDGQVLNTDLEHMFLDCNISYYYRLQM